MIFSYGEPDSQELEVTIRIYELHERLKSHVRQPKRWSGLLRQSTFARAIQGSNSIEGYNVTLEDAFAAVAGGQPAEASSANWEAVMGYRDALTYIMELSTESTLALDETLLKSLHYMMIKYDLSKRPGRWRLGYICVRNQASGQIVYEGPDVEIMPNLLGELIESLNFSNSPKCPILVSAALAHLNLVMIHPFADGNGRMARALQTLVLSRKGLVGSEFTSIEEYLGANTQEYYNVLAEVGAGSWHPERSPKPWVRFCLIAHYRQATTLLRRVKQWDRVWTEMERIIEEHKFPPRYVYALFEASMGWKVRNPNYRINADVSNNLASRDLKDLCDAGFLIPKGEKRGRYYRGSANLWEIYKSTKEVGPIEDPFKTDAAISRGQTIDG